MRPHPLPGFAFPMAPSPWTAGHCELIASRRQP